MAIGMGIIIVCALLGCLKSRSRVIGALIILSLWVLMSLNTANADYVPYEYMYNLHLENVSGVNFGYLFLEQMAWSLNLDFTQFRMLYGACGLILIASFVWRYSSKPNVVMAGYALLPFLYDVVQFKFFLSASICIFAFRFLIDKPKLYVLKYLFCVGVASSIHTGALMFGVFLLGVLSYERAKMLSFISGILAFFLSYSGIASVLAGAFMDSSKQEIYLTNMGRFGWIPYFVSIVGAILICGFSSPEKLGYSLSKCSRNESRFIIYFERAKFALLPLAAILPISVQNFYRPIRSGNLLVILFLVSTLLIDGECARRSEKTMLAILAVAWFVFTQVLIYGGVFNPVVIAELSNNLLW